ncbi:hypothetical protein LNV47_22610 [Paucibacter sp. DJ4R-1]|nr:hypothetical protein [Paucibacter sp. DJ4R-1]
MSRGQLSFVNVRGQRLHVDVHAALARPPSKPRATRAEEDKRHMGFAVVGFPPSQVEEAIKAHNASQQQKPDQEPFQIDAWLSRARPRKGSPKNFSTPTGADQYAEMLRQAGWLRVSVREIIR